MITLREVPYPLFAEDDAGSDWAAPTIMAVMASIVIVLILWVNTIPEPHARPVPGTRKAPERLQKPPGRNLTGYAEAHGYSR